MRTKLYAASMVACAAVGMLAGASALARTSEAQARYDAERAVCMNGSSNQDRHTCLKEAGAALQEARRGELATASANQFERNRLARCDAQRGTDRDDCILRMQGAGTTTGSAQSGGMLREMSRPDSAK
jgi:hypothetical protein